ncbi:MAG: porin family protein [Rickettsiales bacterium]|nr:porin family protein [Rickettsiales bacterium]
MKFFQIIITSSLLAISNFAFSLSNNISNIEAGPYCLAGAGFSRVFEPALFANKNNNSEKIQFSPTATYNAQFGYRINRFFRADINGQYRVIKIKSPANIKSLKIKNYTGATNIFLDFNNAYHLTPYLTAGIGFSGLHIKKNFSNNDINSVDNSNGLSFNFGAGIQIQFSDNFGIDLAYRYADLGKLKVITNTITNSRKLGTHEALANILIIF